MALVRYNVSLGVSILLWQILPCIGCGSNPIIYQATIRDFLPIWCMPFEDFLALDIADPEETPTRFLKTNLLTNETFSYYRGPKGCPYQSYIDRGEISGHPDFHRPLRLGWDMNFLFQIEDKAGVGQALNGTCDLNELQNRSFRDPRARSDKALPDNDKCIRNLESYTPRLNYTKMDTAPSGLPKPQYCTADESGRCGYVLSRSGQKIYQTANKFFQDMWFVDNKKYNKRIGATIQLNELSPECSGKFQFSSITDAENKYTTPGMYAPHGQKEYIFNEKTNPDPFRVKAWPRMRSKVGPLKGHSKFLHTTEIHTFFEYRGDEIFAFDGDDDVWVYINGILAIELGGVHPVVTQTLNLSNPYIREYLNISVGEIYTFDLYQAERQPNGSNFKVTTTLIGGCNVLTSQKALFPSPDGNSFIKSRHVQFAVEDGSVYFGQPFVLLGKPSISSYFFLKEQINIWAGFIIEFKFAAIGQPEGFAFVLHDREEGFINIPMSGGGNLGFKGLKRSIAVAFDMCSDRGLGTDCEKQNLTLYYPEKFEEANKPSESTKRVYDPILRSLKYGDPHEVKIAYYAHPPALEVFLDDSLYLREMPFDPEKAMGTRSAYAGFTAAAGERGGHILFYDWKMQSVDVEASMTVPVDFETGQRVQRPKPLVGDGVASTGYTIQTKDACSFDVSFGERAMNTKGYFVEEVDPLTGRLEENRTTPLVVDAEIVDNQDGSYTYRLRVKSHGTFSLHFFYGDREKSCNLDLEVAGDRYTIKHGNTTDGCYYGSVLHGIQARMENELVTSSPTSFTLPPTESDLTAIYVGGIGAGLIFILGSIAAVFAIKFKLRWLREKQFIEAGSEYKLESMTNDSAFDERSSVGRAVLTTRVAILRERAHLDSISRSTVLGELQTENEELLDQIRATKRRLLRFRFLDDPTEEVFPQRVLKKIEF